MRYYLVLLLSLLSVSSIKAETGLTLAVDSTYLIYNIGQGQFLQCGTNGTALSTSGTKFTFKLATDSCYYLLPEDADNLTAGHNEGLSGTTYDNWNLELAVGSTTANAYVLASRDREMNAFAYLTYSPASTALAANAERPSALLANGLWLLVKPGYYLGDVDGDGDVDLDDLTILSKMILGQENNGIKKAANVNQDKDSKVNIGDATIIIKIANGKQQPTWINE